MKRSRSKADVDGELLNADKEKLIFQPFFRLETAAQLRKFVSSLKFRDPSSQALSFYAATWPDWNSPARAAFKPASVISPDLSSIAYGESPVIFMGSNSWATKPFAEREALEIKLREFGEHLKRLAKQTQTKHLVICVVPEKDYVVDYLFNPNSRFDIMTSLIESFVLSMASHGILVSFKNNLAGMAEFQSIMDFNIPDSHLPGRNYIAIFAELLQKLGLSWRELAATFGIVDSLEYGDLASKFEPQLKSPVAYRLPHIKSGAPEIVAGSVALQEPLGDTWQRISNPAAPIHNSILILGDSHSSILAQRRLSYLFSGVFSDLYFSWNPCGMRPHQIPDNPAGWDYVVAEISQRFVF